MSLEHLCSSTMRRAPTQCGDRGVRVKCSSSAVWVFETSSVRSTDVGRAADFELKDLAPNNDSLVKVSPEKICENFYSHTDG